jgi:metal-dependent amidase/aminoacylase/carboxypeptidase family protein
MPTLDDVKRAVCEAIERQSEKIVTVGETIRKNPELGFKEFKTSRLVEYTRREKGLAPKGGLGITGVRG